MPSNPVRIEQDGQLLSASNPLPVTDADGVVTEVLTALGAPTDAAASSVAVEDATARTTISLLKGIKNILLLLRTALQETFVAGHERLTLAGASAALTIPATATKAVIAAEGGDVRYAPTGAASATSPGYIPAGGIITIPPPAAVYGAAGAYANIVYLA